MKLIHTPEHHKIKARRASRT